MSNILAIGPFIGDFESEIITFRPWVRWLSTVLYYDEMYVNTHFNRSFLYDFIPEKNIIPVYENMSREEENQSGYTFKGILQKDFNLFLRRFKTILMDMGYNKKDIVSYHLSYVKSPMPHPIFNKIFEPISIDFESINSYRDKIIFIPHMSGNERIMNKVYNFLKNEYNKEVVVIGDINTYFPEDNEVLRRIDYIINGFENIIRYITEAKCVICPISLWTMISNLQGVPVFSWGSNVAQYKGDGLYGFDNNKNFILPCEDNASIIIQTMERFIGAI